MKRKRTNQIQLKTGLMAGMDRGESGRNRGMGGGGNRKRTGRGRKKMGRRRTDGRGEGEDVGRSWRKMRGTGGNLLGNESGGTVGRAAFCVFPAGCLRWTILWAPRPRLVLLTDDRLDAKFR